MCLAVALVGQDNPLRLALALRFPGGARVGLPLDLDLDYGREVPQPVEPQAQVIGYGKTGARPGERGADPFKLRLPQAVAHDIGEGAGFPPGANASGGGLGLLSLYVI